MPFWPELPTSGGKQLNNRRMLGPSNKTFLKNRLTHIFFNRRVRTTDKFRAYLAHVYRDTDRYA